MSGSRGFEVFNELCLLEGSVPQMKRAFGILMVGLAEDRGQKLLSKKETL